MRRSSEFLRTIAASGDILNLISGGMSEPFIKLIPLTNAHQLEIKVPGVDAKTLVIEIKNNILWVYQIMNIVTGNQLVKVPRFIYKNAIPHFININGIEARVSGNKLLVQLPFNERADGNHRKVRINEG